MRREVRWERMFPDELTALPPWLFFKIHVYHVRAVAALGFHAAALYTGHCGPHGQDMQPLTDIHRGISRS